MKTASESVPVSISIMDSEYRISCPESERAALLEAARLLDGKMQEIRDSGRILGAERIAVMAALNISYELLKCRQGSEQLHEGTVARVQRLLGRLEIALSKAAKKDV
ncbi:MAG TPA: cell division protein ZapA [Candidatus Competibacteraceae bacterium]|nr:cell division protein ZapA [Candidatus Competibacteraceae bacterium]